MVTLAMLGNRLQRVQEPNPSQQAPSSGQSQPGQTPVDETISLTPQVSRVPAGVTVTAPPGPPSGPVAAPVSPPTNSMAILSLVAGIAGYVLPHPFIAGLIAIYAGHTARKQIRQTGEAGANLALIGLILGYVHLVLSVALVILVILLVVGVGALMWTSTPR
jgi:hypothetical protein